MANRDHGSSRFTQRFTETQKNALLRAVLADGHTVAQARKMARAGQLDAPAFDIGTYAYKLIAAGRDQFEANNEDALNRALADELKGAELDGLATIRAIRHTFKRDGTGDTTLLAKAARDLAQIRKARKDASVQTARPRAKAAAYTGEAEPVNTANQPNVVADLLAKSGQRAGTGSLSQARNPASSAPAA
jgi:hypothetical protein